MKGNGWIDIPVIQAIEYFQNIMNWFMTFAVNYARVIGCIGLLWTGFKLVNARIGVREMLWDTIYKWTVFLILMNCYPLVTKGIQIAANEVGLVAGNSKEALRESFVNLHDKITEDMDVLKQWNEDVNADLSKILSDVSLPAFGKDSDFLVWQTDLGFALNKAIDNTKFDSYQQKRDATNQVAAYMETLTPPKMQTVYSARTLQTLDAILIRRTPDGKATTDLTNSYIDIDLWLKDSSKKETSTFSCASLFRIGLLCGQIMWEQSQMNLVNYKIDVSEGKVKNKNESKMSRWDKTQEKTAATISTMIMAGLGFIIILVSSAFAIIQYVMCSLEFSIIQGIGAFFIPFYLFDITQDIPKKLVPVFTGLFIKIIVMVICFMFVTRLWLQFAVDLINPANGGVSWVALATVIFTGLLSFVLTSNAPKIAMTILTGQPQLSMGELMAAAATVAGGAMFARNMGNTVTSPMTNAAKIKVGEANQRHQASSAAKKEWEKTHSSDIQALHDLKPGKNASKEERASYKSLVDEQKSARNSAGQAASEAVREQQKANYMNNGGAMGTAGRVFAHYTGAAKDLITNPKSYVMGSRQGYQSPGGMHDFIDIAQKSSAAAKNAPPPPPPVPTEDDKKKKILPEELTDGKRES